MVPLAKAGEESYYHAFLAGLFAGAGYLWRCGCPRGKYTVEMRAHK